MPVKKWNYSKDFLVKLLEEMLLIRRFEIQAGLSYGIKKIGGFCHLYIGQEAVAVGCLNAIKMKKDAYITAYRDHGFALLSGLSANQVMAELYGKKTGSEQGRGGSMHMASAEYNFYGGNGIVGAQIPLGAGVALAQRNLKQKAITLCFFGDGAANEGTFHETLNMAKLYHLPVVFICENNHYGMGTSVERSTANPNIWEHAHAYNIESECIDGMNVIDVYEKMKQVAEKVRKTSEPYFLEIKTYRYRGHSVSDPDTYRTKKEIADYEAQDCIAQLKNEMIKQGIISEKNYQDYEAKAKKIAQDSASFADSSAYPEPQEALDFLYAEQGGQA